MKNDEDSIQLSAVEDHDGILTIRGGGARRDWNGIHYKQGMSAKNVGTTKLSANIATIPPGGVARDRPRPYTAPARLSLNRWALSGDWTVTAGATRLEKAGGRIAYRFHARDLHLVMGPPSGKSPVRFRVLIDGHPPGPAHGTDVDAEGNGTATEQRLYQLIRQPGAIEDRQFEIEFLDRGVEAFCFTFG